MVQSAEQIALTCCICRRELLESDLIVQCPRCQTYFHSKHLSMWLDIDESCPICHYHLYQTKSCYPRLKTKNYVKKRKFYRCYYCNHTWEARSLGHQLYCPRCRITSCPHCKSAFGFYFLLRQLQINGQCPNCNKYILLESLNAKITVIIF
jgi:hypothetical protein